MRTTCVTIGLVLVAFVCLAESRPPEFRAEGFHYTEPVAAKVSQLALQKPDVVLEAPPRQTLSSDPPQNGIVRALPQPFEVGRGNRIAAAGDAVAVFRSMGAGRVRLHLTQLQFPAGAQLAVSGMDGKAVTVDTGLLMPDGSLWTPSVGGDTIALTFPASSSFVVADVAHIFSGGTAPNATDCFTDVACNSFPDKAALSSAVAQLTFIKDSSTFVCSGGRPKPPPSRATSTTPLRAAAARRSPATSASSARRCWWRRRRPTSRWCAFLRSPRTAR